MDVVEPPSLIQNFSSLNHGISILGISTRGVPTPSPTVFSQSLWLFHLMPAFHWQGPVPVRWKPPRSNIRRKGNNPRFSFCSLLWIYSFFCFFHAQFRFLCFVWLEENHHFASLLLSGDIYFKKTYFKILW